MIGLYCPDVPPAPGGVSDHTLALARALERVGERPAVFARRGDPAGFAPLACVTGLAPGAVAGAALEHGVTTLVVQYVPFLFARRGVSPSLALGIGALRRAGIRIAVIVHEAFVPFTRLAWLVTGVPQRLQFAWLARSASHLYAPIPQYADLARRYGGRRPVVRVAPIGATIPVASLDRAEARRRLGLTEEQIAIGVFSPAAHGFRRDWIGIAAARLAERPQVVWVTFGNGGDVALPGLRAGRNAILAGPADPATIAVTMRAMDAAAAPYIDGLTMRRSGAMLALASGVPLVSSTGHLYDPTLGALAACEPTPAAFADRLARLVDDPDERARWARATARYQETASIEVLANLLRSDLART